MPIKSISTWVLAPLLLQAFPLVASAATIQVPLQQPTIQAGINSAVTGDVVLVSPGTYNENINFNGKAITVLAALGARPVIISGSNNGSVVTFDSGEGLTSVLSGFIIANGLAGSANNACFDEGGGICISNASPTIEYNTIEDNGACNGAGISISFGSPLVYGNLIANNSQKGCTGGIGGGGISVGGAASARIINNIIQGNTMIAADGGGISLYAAGTPTITGNIIRSNTAKGLTPCTSGGGISMENQSDATIVQNQINGNTATCGAGISFSVPSGARGPYLVNNTFSDNAGGPNDPEGAGVYADGFDATALLINNIIVAGPPGDALYCGNFTNTTPLIKFNDIYGANDSAYGGTCTDQTGTNGNISADPLFVSETTQNYHVETGSPVIGAGSTTAPNLLSVDFAGVTRIQNGKVDLGLYEFLPAQAAAAAASFPIGNADHRSSRAANSQTQSSGKFYKTGSDKRRTVYAYDATGKLIVQTDPNGVRHNW